MVFVAGQIALDPSTSKIVGEKDVAKQTEQVIVNIKAVLEAGSRIQDVVKTTVFLADMNDFAMNAVYARYFEEASASPCLCPSSRLQGCVGGN